MTTARPRPAAALALAALLSPVPRPAAAQDLPLPSDERVAAVHLLNRISYGPRPGDVKRVLQTGLHEYVTAQLHPETVPDSGLQRRLTRYPTLALESSEIAAEYGRDAGRDAVRTPVRELAAARVERALYGERQLEEVMVDFWLNHFNVFAGKGATRLLLTSYERDAIRPHALGRFEDLLAATARHPAMLFYLDNWLSVAPGAAPPRGREERRVPDGLNENYARELLELHTLGVDGGYEQADIVAVARAFTGWSVERPRRGGGFVFHAWAHDDGPKTVLGQPLPGGGEEEAQAVLSLLAAHPSTARFVSRKLAQRFVADDPPEELVERMAETWRLTGGDIREVLHALLESEAFWDPVHAGAKVKTPFELLASAARALGAEPKPEALLRALRALDHVPYAEEAPTGYPEEAAAWLDAGALDRRVEIARLFAERLAGGARPAARGEDSSAALLEDLFPAGASPELRAAVADAAQRSPVEALALALGSPEFQKQ